MGSPVQKTVARPAANPAPSHPDAFTIIELLITVGILGFLMALLLPVLSQGKSRGKTMVSGNNLKQLAVAWMIYADDHEGRVPPNFGAQQVNDEIANGTYRNWVNNVLDWTDNPQNTNTALLFAGGLGPYLGGQENVYRCPSDYVLSDLQEDLGWRARTRSYSMNAMIGDAGDFTTGGTNVNNPHYRQFFAATDIPMPSDIFVFIEEHPDSINDGYFLNNPYTGQWMDLPASYHNGGANLSFADGHVEYHKWQVSSTRHAARAFVVSLPLALTDKERADFYWVMQRMSIKSAEKR
jgi:prepilin-type processing-associated H-X9-DG protein